MRRPLSVLLLALMLPLLALGGVALLRAEVALYALDRWLAARGLEGSVEALSVELERVEIHGLRVEQAQVRRVEFSFEPLLLLRGELPALVIEGLELPLDLTGEGPPLGRLQALLGEPAEAAEGWRSLLPADPPALPPMRLEDGRLLLATPLGPVTLELWGALDRGDEDDDLLALSFAAEGAEGLAVVGALDTRLRRLRPTSLLLDASLEMPAYEVSGRFAAKAPALAAGEPLQLSGNVRGDAAALVSLLPEARLRPVGGHLALDLEGALTLPPLPYLDAAPPANWIAWTTARQAEAELDLALDGLVLPEVAERASLHGGLSLRHGETGAEVVLRDALEAEVSGLGPSLLGIMPPPLAERLQSGGRLRLAAAGDAPLLRLVPGEDGTAAAQLSLLLPDGARMSAELAAELPWPPGVEEPLPRLRIAALEAQGAAAPFAESLRLSATGELVPRNGSLAAALQLQLEARDTPQAKRLLLDGDLQLEPAPEGFTLAFDLDATAEGSAYAESLRLRATGRAEGSPAQATADLELNLAAGAAALADVAAGTARIKAPLRLDYADARLGLELTGPATVQAASLRSEMLEPIETIELTLDSLRVDLDLEEEPKGRVALQATLAPLTLGLVGMPIHRLDLRPRPLLLEAGFDATGPTEGLIEIVLDSLVVPERELTLADLRVELPLGPEAPLLHLRQLRLYSDAVPALFPPLDITATLQRDLRFEARGRGLDGAFDLRARGHHDLGQRRGEASLTLAPLNFTPGGLQPSAFGPYAAELADVGGRLQGESRLTWSDRGFDGTARIVGSTLDLRYGGTSLQGMDFDIALEGLQPPRTAAPQRITLRRIEAGLPPLTEAEILVTLATGADGSPHLLLQRAEAGFAGGRLRLVEGRLDPGAERYAARLEIEQVDLQPLLELLALEELGGRGRVTGTIPVELREGAIAIYGGLLEGETEGVIAFRSPAAREALAAGGEAVSLMFDALEDFHYEVLEIGLDKALTGETQVRLRLLGANPEVLDGHPFDLNINLETDAAPLLDALGEGRRIQRGVMDQLWRLVR